ncbi:MAG: CBS domain-containing protein [Gammaproteobacteria bacterium]|nr:CBS domain-containing protein [Gammaproteobacteria bacterium]
MDHHEARFIDQIFEFTRKTVADVMTPRSAMFCLPIETSPAEIVREFVRCAHSRMPYRGHRDTIVGVLYTRDLLKPSADDLLKEPNAIESLLREPLLVPEMKSASELFETFRKRNLTFALTVDEYGGVTGLVTMKDLLEHIFGEIRSLSDAAKMQGIENSEEGRYAIDGELTVEAFNREMHSHLSGWHAHTVAGLVLNAYGELPPVGTTVELDRIQFLVDAVDHNRIRRLIVTLPKTEDSNTDDVFSTDEIINGEDLFPGDSPGKATQQSDTEMSGAIGCTK